MDCREHDGNQRPVASPPATGEPRGAQPPCDHRRLADHLRAAEPAVCRPAADRAALRAPARLHRAHRPGQLPDPAADRQARMGVGDDSRSGGRIRGRQLRARSDSQGQRCDRQPDHRGASGAGHGPRHRPGLHRHLLTEPTNVRCPYPRRSAAVQPREPGAARRHRDTARRRVRRIQLAAAQLRGGLRRPARFPCGGAGRTRRRWTQASP